MQVKLIAPAALEGAEAKLITAVSYVPKVRKNVITTRRYNALVYVARGEYRYRCGRDLTVVSAGSCMYLPPWGKRYSYEIAEGETETVQVDFELRDADGPVALSREPRLFSGDTVALRELMESLTVLTAEDSPAERLALRARMTLLLSFLARSEEKSLSRTQQRIAPAQAYIRSHFCQRIPIEALAAQCKLSPSQLRRLFREQVGMSPLAYRNLLRMEKAEALLAATDLNVSEISHAVGFEDVYAFSHAFKKHKGVSPRRYQAQLP